MAAPPTYPPSTALLEAEEAAYASRRVCRWLLGLLPIEGWKRLALDMAVLLEVDDHAVSLEEWGRFLWEQIPGEYADPPPPVEPCDAPAGTEERLACLADRHARGEGLWHQGDGVPDGLSALVVRGESGSGQVAGIVDDRDRRPGSRWVGSKWTSLQGRTLVSDAELVQTLQAPA